MTQLAWLGLTVLVAVGLRFGHISSQSLWLDEGFTLAYARTATPSEVIRHISACHATECISPLYPLVVHLLIRWLGDSVFVLRGFSAVCGVATVIAMVAAARRLFDIPTAGLAGVLTSLSAFAIWYSQDARSYSMLLLIVTMQIGFLAPCIDPTGAMPDWRNRLLLASSVCLGLFGNILFALSAVALCTADFLIGTHQHRWWSSWWPAMVAGLPAVLFVGASPLGIDSGSVAVTELRQTGVWNAVYSVYGQLVGLTFGPPQAALRGADKLPALRGHEAALACAAILAALLAIIVAAARRRRDPLDRRWHHVDVLTASIGIAIVEAIAVALTMKINWQPRHSFFLFPPLVLLISFSARELVGTRGLWHRIVVLVALGLFCITNLWSLYNYFEDPRYGKDDYRGVAGYLVRAQNLGQRSVLLSGSAVLLRYYGDSSTVDLTEAEDSAVVRRLRDLAGPRGELLVVLNREFYWRRGVGVNSVLGSAFEVREHKQLQYFDLYHLVRR